jgi:hypothetical protein
MSEKVLIANRGEQLSHGGAAMKSNCVVAAGHEGDSGPEIIHV